MYLTRSDFDKIKHVLSKFPNAEHFALEQESVSGIGDILTMKINSTINDIDGEFSIEISSVDTW